MSKSKLTTDILAVGAASLAVSVVTEKVLLTPRKEIPVGGNVKIPIEGLFSFSQEYVAKLARAAFNTALPWYAKTMSSVFDRFDLKVKTREATIWFAYDFLGRYSMNTLVSHFVAKNENLDKTIYKNALSEMIQKYITEKTDRDVLIQTITAEIVRVLRAISEGTLLALVFNDRFAVALSGTLAAAVDRFIQNEAATRLTDFVFDMASHLEKFTFPNFLTNVLGISRDDMAAYIDLIYDLLLGEKMVNAFEAARFGDVAYGLLTDIDFDEVGRYIEKEMKKDVIKLNISAVSSAVYFYRGATGAVGVVTKQVQKVSKTANRVRRLLPGGKKRVKAAALASSAIPASTALVPVYTEPVFTETV